MKKNERYTSILSFKKGFTMVELIVVLVILAVLAAVAVPALMGYIDSSKEKEYIAQAEAALASTQSAFTEIYNDGNNRLTPSRRLVARAEAGFESGMTAFTVWTSAQLKDGETEANSDHIASYMVSYAKFEAEDGTIVVLRNNVWTVFKNEAEAKNAEDGMEASLISSQGNDDGDVTGSVHDNVVYVWKKGNPEVVSEREDTAFYPTTRKASKDESEWNDDDKFFDTGIKVVFHGYIVLGKDKQTQLIKFKKESGNELNSVAFVYNGQNWNEDPDNYQRDTALGEAAGYDTDSRKLRWVYATSQIVNDQIVTSEIKFDDYNKVKEYLSEHYNILEGKEVSLYAFMPHDYAPLSLSFAPYNPRTLSVSLDQDVLKTWNDDTTDRSRPVLSGNTITLKWDKVDKVYSDESLKVLNNLSKTGAVNASQNSGLDVFGTGIATYNHEWVISIGENYVRNEDGTYQTFELTDNSTGDDQQSGDDQQNDTEDESVNSKENGIKTYIESLSPVGENATTSVTLKTAADIHRTVYLHATDSQGNEVGIFEDGDDSLYDLTFKQNELPDSEILDEKGNKVDSQYDFVDQAQMTYETTTNLAGAARSNSPKKWNAFDCKKDGTAPSNKRSISKADYEKEIREEITDHLFAENSALYGMMVEAEVGYLTAQLDYDEYSTDEASRNNPAKLCLYFRQLADSKETRGKPNEIENLVIHVDKVMYINKDDRAANGYYSDNFHKEFCISTTKMLENPNSVDGKHVLDWGYGTDKLGDFRVDEENQDEEYPDYIVAYSVKTGNTYSIYVFTDADNSDLKAEESMQALFFGYREMTENTFIQHLDTSDVKRFKGMFGRCQEMTGYLDIRTFDITKSADASQMFYRCGITGIRTSSGFNTQFNNYFDKMFAYCPNLVSVPEINIRAASDIFEMFRGCTSLQSVCFTGKDAADVDDGDGNNLGKTDLLTNRSGDKAILDVFSECDSLQSITIEEIYSTHITNLKNLYGFDDDPKSNRINNLRNTVTKIIIKNVDMPNLKTTEKLFKGYSELTYVDFEGFMPARPDANGTPAVNASYMFEDCESLTGGSDPSSEDYVNLSTFGLSIFKANLMFKGCTSLVIADLEMDTSHIKDMSNMFEGCNARDQKPVSFHIDAATSIKSMFSGCEHLEEVHLIGPGKDSSTKNTMGNGGIANVLSGCTDLKTVSISDITFSNLTGFGSFFESAGESLENVTFSYVGIPKVTSFKDMFKGFSSLTTVEFTDTDTSKVKDMSFMFYDCSSLINANLKGLNTSAAENMESMFQNCSGIVIQDLGLSTLKAKNMKNMFNGCTAVQTKVDIHIDAAEAITSMFEGCSNLLEVNFYGAGKKKTPASSLNANSTTNLFDGCSGLKRLMINGVNFGNLEGFENFIAPVISSLEGVTLSNLSIPQITSFQALFQGGEELERVSFLETDTSNVTDMTSMFEGCKKLTTSNLTNLNTSSAEEMSNMFKECEKLTIVDLELNTTNAVDMSNMFNGCNATTNTSTGTFHIDRADNIASMFANCSNLTEAHLVGAGMTGNVVCTVDDDSATDVFKSTSLHNLTIEKVIFNGFSAEGETLSGLKNMIDSAEENLQTFVLKEASLPNLKTFSGLLQGQPDLTSVEIRNIDAPNLYCFKNLMRDSTTLSSVVMRGLSFKMDKLDFSCAFLGCTGLLSVDFGVFREADAFTAEYLDDCNSMFAGCSSLVELNLTAFNSKNILAAKTMFAGCTSLETIKVIEPEQEGDYGLDLSKVENDMAAGDDPLTDLVGMFDGCTNLLGGNGTLYDPSNKGKAYAKVDREGQVGYFTDGRPQVVELKALGDNWQSNLATKGSITGFERATGITRAQAIENAGGESKDMAATGEARSVYMWMEGSTLKWWSDAEILKLSSNTIKMFNGWTSLTTVDLSGLDFSEVTNMSRFFEKCTSLTSVDFGQADISAVTDFSYMFSGCTSLQSVSMNIDTSGVSSGVTMTHMFSFDKVTTDLRTVNIIGDWSNVTDVSYMLEKATKITTINFGEHVDMSRLYTINRFLDGATSDAAFNAFKNCFANWDMGENALFEDPNIWNNRATNQRTKVNNSLGWGNRTLTDGSGKNYKVDDNKYIHIVQ